jgi:hypothetical protein
MALTMDKVQAIEKHIGKLATATPNRPGHGRLLIDALQECLREAERKQVLSDPPTQEQIEQRVRQGVVAGVEAEVNGMLALLEGVARETAGAGVWVALFQALAKSDGPSLTTKATNQSPTEKVAPGAPDPRD